ncbi:MAG TPA: carboxylate-amine ligase, partial [Rhodospirillum rubrum]|nr:carboxylate-amine ligase [Rhodospirillum rubrum]
MCIRDRAEVLHARTILHRGTSAHNQLRVFAEARAGGMTRDEALVAVVDHLIAQTVAPLGADAGAPGP